MEERLRHLRTFALIAAIWLAAGIGRLALPQAGLLGQYFPNATWSDPPARSVVDPEVSTAQLSRGWRYTPPDVFTVRWSGYLHVSRAGDYLFTLTSDDGSRLSVDRQIVIDNTSAHGPPGRSGRLHLDQGRYPIVLEYSQTGGAYLLEWSWASGGEAATAVPAWRLSPHPSRYPLLFAQWMATTLWPYATLALIGIAWQFAMRRGWWPRRPVEVDRPDAGRRPAVGSWQAAACAALFVVLAVVHTWPLATGPGRLSRNDNADTLLNEWTMAWVAHEIPRHPGDLFNANIFYPERGALAFSEALILQGIAAAPMLWAGASPVLAYNVMLLAGFVLTGWTMCIVVAKWTGDWLAGIASGTVIAFNAHTLTRLSHIQAQHAALMIVALFLLDALLRKPRWSTAAWLAAATALQASASIYLFVFAIVALLVAALVRPEDWIGQRFRPVLGRLVFAAGLATLLLLPLLQPYWQLRSRGFVRSLDEVAWFAATARDYITTPARWYPWAGGAVALFPGAIALLLAVLPVATTEAFRDRRLRMCLAFGAVGMLLSFGPAVVPGYETLYNGFPPLQAVRTTSRFGYLALLGVAAMAGYGVALLRRLGGANQIARVCVALVMIALAVEPLAAPIEYTPFSGIASIYHLPESEPNAVVVELPFPPAEKLFRNAPYMLNATAHWKPMLNGYSGFWPPSYVDHFAALADFPSDASIAALQAAHVTDVFVHLDQLDPDASSRLNRQRALRVVATEGTVTLYHLDRR